MKLRSNFRCPKAVVSNCFLYGKKGQLYLTAAIIIIIIIFGLAAVKNYASAKKEPQKVQELSNILDLEGAKVIEYGKYTGQETGEVIGRFTGMLKEYIQNTNEDISLVVVQGNITTISVIGMARENTGEVSATVGTQKFGITSTAYNPASVPFERRGENEIEITISNKTYALSLNPDENFIFIITKSEGFENYVRTNA